MSTIIDTSTHQISECEICMESHTNFWHCGTCSNKHCQVCHTRIINRKCPFCRSPFNSGSSITSHYVNDSNERIEDDMFDEIGTQYDELIYERVRQFQERHGHTTGTNRNNRAEHMIITELYEATFNYFRFVNVNLMTALDIVQDVYTEFYEEDDEYADSYDSV